MRKRKSATKKFLDELQKLPPPIMKSVVLESVVLESDVLESDVLESDDSIPTEVLSGADVVTITDIIEHSEAMTSKSLIDVFTLINNTLPKPDKGKPSPRLELVSSPKDANFAIDKCLLLSFYLPGSDKISCMYIDEKEVFDSATITAILNAVIAKRESEMVQGEVFINLVIYSDECFVNSNVKTVETIKLEIDSTDINSGALYEALKSASITNQPLMVGSFAANIITEMFHELPITLCDFLSRVTITQTEKLAPNEIMSVRMFQAQYKQRAEQIRRNQKSK